MSVVVLLDAFAATVLLVLLGLVGLALRRRFLTRQGGTFDCSLRLRPSSHGKGWALGIGRYAGDCLEWYRVFSYAARPRLTMRRDELEILDRRPPAGPEVFSLLAGAVVVRCRHAGGLVEVAMSPDALTGFLAWVESGPPRSRV
ncbi:MAG: hypothetical protein QOI54_1044 [Actinomycetota bacterium]|jgi:hypothetical protein|nr:hypothetical protein [Actinomycetota bacterium]